MSVHVRVVVESGAGGELAKIKLKMKRGARGVRVYSLKWNFATHTLAQVRYLILFITL